MILEIEDALRSVARTHGFSSVGVGVMDINGERHVFTADVHWTGGKSATGLTCASGMSDTSVEDALSNAIAEANEKRSPFYSEDGAFPTYSFGGLAQ